MAELLSEYRIVEKIYADGKSKFVPEQKILRPHLGDEGTWDTILPKSDEGFSNIDSAMEAIQAYKKILQSKTLVKEIIHEYK
jgi:hypothetical protein